MCAIAGGVVINTLTTNHPEDLEIASYRIKRYLGLMRPYLEPRGPDRFGESELVDGGVHLHAYRGIPSTEDVAKYIEEYKEYVGKNKDVIILPLSLEDYDTQPYVLNSIKNAFGTEANSVGEHLQRKHQGSEVKIHFTHNGLLNNEIEILNTYLARHDIKTWGKNVGTVLGHLLEQANYPKNDYYPDIDSYAMARALMFSQFTADVHQPWNVMREFNGSYAVAAYIESTTPMTNGTERSLVLASTFRQIYYLYAEKIFLWCSDLQVLQWLRKKHFDVTEIVEIGEIKPYQAFRLPVYESRSHKYDSNQKAAGFVQVGDLAPILTKVDSEFFDRRIMIKNDAMRPFENLHDKVEPFNGKIVSVLSGGMDSMLATYMVADQLWDYMLKYDIQKPEIHLLHFMYGAKAQEPEIQSVKDIAEDLDRRYNYKIKVVTEFIDGTWLKNLGGSTLTTDADISTGEKGVETVSEWVPARNLWMMGTVASYCDRWNIRVITLGLNENEAGVYADNSPEFIDKMDEVLSLATQARPQLIIPVRSMMKHEIVRKNYELNTPMHKSWSCYLGGLKRCGKCGPDFMRLQAHEVNWIKETVEYETYPNWFHDSLKFHVEEVVHENV